MKIPTIQAALVVSIIAGCSSDSPAPTSGPDGYATHVSHGPYPVSAPDAGAGATGAAGVVSPQPRHGG